MSVICKLQVTSIFANQVDKGRKEKYVVYQNHVYMQVHDCGHLMVPMDVF